MSNNTKSEAQNEGLSYDVVFFRKPETYLTHFFF